LADYRAPGQHAQTTTGSPRKRDSSRLKLALVFIVAGVTLAVATMVAVHFASRPASGPPSPLTLPASPDSYIGLYPHGVPNSYAPVKAFTTATGVKPDVVPYYSGWFEPFQASFAKTAANDGVVPLVQIDPDGVSVARIAAGDYDSYLDSYAKAVRTYKHPVILSFGHEMNGYWYSWGYQHTSPQVFVAAWRHIVTMFRALGVTNVTWLWTINIVNDPEYGRIPSPAKWWPGQSYVTWVGIDGYYYSSSTVFTALFGPTIVAVRALTHSPILIAETAVAPRAGQSAKISDLFAGVHLYGLLGFIWFDSNTIRDWRLTSPAAIAALRRGAGTIHQPKTLGGLTKVSR
jgi:mannan endo-1,4-beta-mannosidase